MIPESFTLNTPNYLLRIPNKSDVELVWSASRYAGFNDGMQWDPPTEKDSIAASIQRSILRWQEGESYSLTIVSKQNNEAVGRVSIRPVEGERVWDIGYWTHPDQQGKGVMKEALGAVLEFGFSQLHATKITAFYAIWNKASEKVLVNHGFKFIRHIEKGFHKRGEWVSENEMHLLKKDWENNPAVHVALNDFSARLIDNPNAIYEDDDLVVLLDIDPISLGHIIICPKTHYTDFHEMPDELIQKMMLLAKRYVLVLQKLFPSQGYSMMLNAGAFNDLKHCHLHVFPRNHEAEFQWTFDETQLPEEAKNVEMLKQLLKGYF